MKIITVGCTARTDKRDELISLCKNMIAPSRAESGCIQYYFYQDVTDENKFFFYEEWKDQAAIDFHFSTKHYLDFSPKYDSLIEERAKLTIYNAQN